MVELCCWLELSRSALVEEPFCWLVRMARLAASPMAPVCLNFHSLA